VESGWQKKRAAEAILEFFQLQGLNTDDPANLWIEIMGKK
jgi:hypothetical protein